MNNLFIYEKTSDFKKLIKPNKKIEKSNDPDNIIQKHNNKLPIKKYEFYLQQVAKFIKKPQKNIQNIKAW